VLFTFASVQTCGVTTAVLALASAWPTDRDRVPLVAELDPAGGTIAARFGLTTGTGVVTLAAALRSAGSRSTTETPATFAPHAQELPGGTRVLAAPIAGREVVAALDVLADSLPRAASGPVDVRAYCGRLPEPIPDALRHLFRRSAATVLVVRPELSHLLRLQERLPEIRHVAERAVLLLCGEASFPPDQVESELGCEVIGYLPPDPDAARMLGGGASRGRGPRRLPLFRSAAAVASALTTVLLADAPEPRPAEVCG